MTHEERRNMSNSGNTDTSEQKSMTEQLSDANHEIEGLRLQLAWFERSCDDL